MLPRSMFGAVENMIPPSHHESPLELSYARSHVGCNWHELEWTYAKFINPYVGVRVESKLLPDWTQHQASLTGLGSPRHPQPGCLPIDPASRPLKLLDSRDQIVGKVFLCPRFFFWLHYRCDQG